MFKDAQICGFFGPLVTKRHASRRVSFCSYSRLILIIILILLLIVFLILIAVLV
jgi:hypothetical protein